MTTVSKSFQIRIPSNAYECKVKFFGITTAVLFLYQSLSRTETVFNFSAVYRTSRLFRIAVGNGHCSPGITDLNTSVGNRVERLRRQCAYDCLHPQISTSVDMQSIRKLMLCAVLLVFKVP